MGKLFPAFAGQGLALSVPPWRDFVAALLNFCSCTQDKFVMAVAPGHAHLHAIRILYRDKLGSDPHCTPSTRDCPVLSSGNIPPLSPFHLRNEDARHAVTHRQAPSLKLPTRQFLYARPLPGRYVSFGGQ